MARIAGDSPTYEFRLCRIHDGLATPTKYGFGFVSVTTFIGEVMGKPAGAMSYWGFRIGMQGVMEALADGESLEGLEADDMEAVLKARGVSPNMRRDEAGDRGNSAHQILEWLGRGFSAGDEGAEAINDRLEAGPSFREVAEAYAEHEERSTGTRYGWGVIEWWDEKVQPYIDDGSIVDVQVEVPVWSFKLQTAGMFDLALLFAPYLGAPDGGWEVIDLKTHKPAQGFTKPGFGPGYVSEAAQIRTYRMCWEEMGKGKTFRQRTLVVRDKDYRGKCWLEDYREVPEEFVRLLRQAYDHKVSFEKGEA